MGWGGSRHGWRMKVGENDRVGVGGSGGGGGAGSSSKEVGIDWIGDQSGGWGAGEGGGEERIFLHGTDLDIH